jgi:hypothetical protein
MYCTGVDLPREVSLYLYSFIPVSPMTIHSSGMGILTVEIAIRTVTDAR